MALSIYLPLSISSSAKTILVFLKYSFDCHSPLLFQGGPRTLSRLEKLNHSSLLIGFSLIHFPTCRLLPILLLPRLPSLASSAFSSCLCQTYVSRSSSGGVSFTSLLWDPCWKGFPLSSFWEFSLHWPLPGLGVVWGPILSRSSDHVRSLKLWRHYSYNLVLSLREGSQVSWIKGQSETAHTPSFAWCLLRRWVEARAVWLL